MDYYIAFYRDDQHFHLLAGPWPTYERAETFLPYVYRAASKAVTQMGRADLLSGVVGAIVNCKRDHEPPHPPDMTVEEVEGLAEIAGFDI